MCDTIYDTRARASIIKRGWFEYEQCQYVKAKNCWVFAINVYGSGFIEDPEIFNIIGDVYHVDEGNYDEAEKYYELAANRGNFGGKLNLGWFAVCRKNEPKAREW